MFIHDDANDRAKGRNKPSSALALALTLSAQFLWNGMGTQPKSAAKDARNPPGFLNFQSSGD